MSSPFHLWGSRWTMMWFGSQLVYVSEFPCVGLICAPIVAWREIYEACTHGISSRFNRGRHSGHAAVNDIIKRSLESAKIPCHLYRANGALPFRRKRPDGASVVPWRRGEGAGLGRYLP